MANSMGDVKLQMSARGIDLAPRDHDRLDADGKKRTIGVKGKAWAKLYEHTLADGRRIITGSFGSYKTGEWWKVEHDARAISEEERAAIRAREAAARERAAAAKAEAAELASMRADALLARASITGESAYLARKGVEGESVRYLRDGSIVVPMMRYDRPREARLVGAQVIDARGEKRFVTGTAKSGAACRLGGALTDTDQPILVCEGLATGLTIRMATGRRMPVFVAFDAGNLLPVAQILRKLYPAAWIVFCADDDWRTMVPPNPGKNKAHEAARAIKRADLITPYFSGERGPKDTDFNDLHAREGLDTVAAQFARAFAIAGKHGRRVKAA